MIAGRLRGLPVVVFEWLKMSVVGGKSASYCGVGHCVNCGLWVNQWKKVKFRHVLCCLLRKNL